MLQTRSPLQERDNELDGVLDDLHAVTSDASTSTYERVAICDAEHSLTINSLLHHAQSSKCDFNVNMVLNSLPLHVLRNLTRWSRVSEGCRNAKDPRVKSSMRARVRGLDETADMARVHRQARVTTSS